MSDIDWGSDCLFNEKLVMYIFKHVGCILLQEGRNSSCLPKAAVSIHICSYIEEECVPVRFVESRPHCEEIVPKFVYEQ